MTDVSAQATSDTAAQLPYRIRAHSIEACNCKHGCNCQFGGFPNEGPCEFMIGLDITEGHYGKVDLKGVRAVIGAKYPKAIHEGHGHVVLFIDESANSDQVDALATILSGQAGGMPWEAVAGTIETLEGPLLKPIEMTVDGRRSRFQIPGILEMNLTPLKDIMSGEEKEVHIVYPKGGFFWDDADIATTDTMQINYNGLSFEYPDRYAAYAPVHWTNQQ